MAPALLLFLVVPWVWASLSSPLLAAADGRGGKHCPPVLCGNVTISFPFAIVPEEATATSCGATGFQVTCPNNTPFLGYNRLYSHQFQILDIFYNDASMLVADVHKLQDFNDSASEHCHAPTNNSSYKLGLPFSISANNENLIMYNCMNPLPEEVWRREGLVEMSCGNRTFVRVADRRSGDDSGGYGNYFMEGCNATVVPVLARSGEANASNYKELVRDGFLLTWQPPGTLHWCYQ